MAQEVQSTRKLKKHSYFCEYTTLIDAENRFKKWELRKLDTQVATIKRLLLLLVRFVPKNCIYSFNISPALGLFINELLLRVNFYYNVYPILFLKLSLQTILTYYYDPSSTHRQISILLFALSIDQRCLQIICVVYFGAIFCHLLFVLFVYNILKTISSRTSLVLMQRGMFFFQASSKFRRCGC